MAQKNSIFRAVREVSDERAVDLDRVHRQALQVPQRGVSGAEIVQRDAAASITQGIDEPGALFDVVERRGLGNFDDQATP